MPVKAPSCCRDLQRLSFLLLCIITTGTPQSAFPAAAEPGLPLAAARSVKFTTGTASWLSVDVHPDGRTLLMEVLGDLYTAPVAGGQALRISSGMAFDSQPVWSPDGRTIAFISDRSGAENIWLMDADGSTPRQLTREKGDAEFASPAFSPDGRHVIVSRSTWGLRTFELWAHAIDGGKGVQITTAKSSPTTPLNDRHNALGPVYSPDGRYVYYARRTGGFAYNLTLPAWQIARRDLREGREDILTGAEGSGMKPVLSPDGKRLVYATRYRHATGLRLRHLESGEDRWLAWPVERDEQESRFTRDLLPGYDFAPDGRTIYASRDGRIHRIDVESGSSEPVEIRFDVEQALGERLYYPWRLGMAPVKARVLMGTTRSPDGRNIAFSAFGAVHVHDPVRGETRQVSPEGMAAYQPAFAPDGRSLAFVSWSQEGGHIWRVGTRRGAAERLTRDAAYYTEPVFTPDGGSIIALRGSGQERQFRDTDLGQVEGADLIRLPASGGPARAIASAGDLQSPHFGPEKDRLYLFSSPGPFARTGGGTLLSMRLDGTDRRTHLQVKGPGTYLAEEETAPQMLSMSPDGRHVLVRHANQLHVIQLLGNAYGDVVHSLTAPSLPQVQLTDVGADSAGWSADGRKVYWSTGSRYQERPVDSLVYRDPDAEENGNPPGEVQTGSSAESPAAPDAIKAASDKPSDTPAEADTAVTHHDIDVYRPRYVPDGAFALVNTTVLTMEPGTAPITDGVVIVRGDRIEAAGPRAGISIPEDAEVIDLEGRWVMPGFIDTHAHYRAMRGVLDADNPSFLANLAYGVTTGIDVQPSTVDILAYQDLIDAGLAIGPRVLTTGPGVFSNNAFRSAAHAEHVLTRYRDHYGVRNLKAYMSGNRQQRQWLAQAAAKLRLMPTTEGGLDMKLDLTHVIDGFSGNEHNFPLLDLRDDVVRLVSESKIAYTPTLLVSYGGHFGEGWFFTRESPLGDPKLNRYTPWPDLAGRTLRRPWAHESEHVFPALATQARKIVDAGGQVGIGAHGQLQGLGFHWEMRALGSGGMTNLQVLTSATRMGAEMIGAGEDLGTLTPGKLADMVVLDADPLLDLRSTVRLSKVIRGGVVHDATTLDQEWPLKKPLPDMWWWHIDPPGLESRIQDRPKAVK